MTRPLRICFVSPEIYPILSGDTSVKFAGGAEVQQTYLAREFARRGHEVTAICMNHGQADAMVVDGVKVYRSHSPKGGVPGLRFLYPRLTSTWVAMARANADIYYQRTCAIQIGMVAAFALRQQRSSIYAAAHDMDFHPGIPLLKSWRDKQIYRWGVRHANAVVVQSERQQTACKAMFGIESTVINSCYGHRGADATHEGVILWVATIKTMKRPELFVALAKALPQYRFKIVGGGADYDMKNLYRDAAGVKNLEVVGFIPFAQVEEQFDRASIFVNTSTSEGFPNTFLQAWSRKIPSVSFFDPAAQVDGRRVGLVAHSFESMLDQIKLLKADVSLWRERGNDCCRYISEQHSIEQAANSYETIFRKLVQPKGRV